MGSCTGRQALRSSTLAMRAAGAGQAFFLVDQRGIVRGKWIGEDLAVFPNDVLLKAAQEVAAKP